MDSIPDLCSSSLPSTTTLREKLAEYFEETKDLIEKLSDDAALKRSKKSSDSADDSSTDEDEQIPSVSSAFTSQQEIITKLRNLSDCVEESTWILAALADIKFNQCNQMECDMEKRNDEILFLQKKITELKSSSKFSTSNWSSMSPELLSLRRSHDSRLDYVCKIKRELTHEKQRNSLLLRKQAEIQADSAAITLSFQIECDRLKEDLENEKQKNELNNAQILYLKKRLMEEKAKGRNKANRLSKVNKNSVKLLQRQLCALNVSGNKAYQSPLKFKKSKHVQIRPRPRLHTAPLPSSTVSVTSTTPLTLKSSPTKFGVKSNQNSAQDVVKYLNDTSKNFVIPKSFLNENDMPLLKLPNELPVLTLDENF